MAISPGALMSYKMNFAIKTWRNMKTTREESDSKRALSPCKPQPSEGYEKQRQSSGRGGQQATLPHTPGDHSA